MSAENIKHNGNSKYVCIHGHFYQPPRENAWLEIIEMQDSAHPYHDWNERISSECYMPNSCSRILGAGGVIKNIVNNYSKINFNFGPTLLSWMEQKEPEVYQDILEADKESMKYFDGHGSAIAQVYNHIIMPLASRRDKETQIRWGISDFTYRFKRKPEGMWLAETAVDTETLELLVDNDISYTILAPRQAKAFKKIDEAKWTITYKSSIDTSRAYRYVLPSGRSIALFFYNGDLSQSVAFNGLLNDGAHFAQSILDTLDYNLTEPQLAHIATDGETYGHHHKYGEMALSYCIDLIENSNKATLVNYAQFLAMHPPLYDVQIHENSSWSCVHGVERWRSNCGCCSGMNPGWHQQWRAPLRGVLDWLRDQIVELVEAGGYNFLKDPWKARNAYIAVILNRTNENINAFLLEHALPDMPKNQILRLMELQRNALLMFTSCGWFFDEISGIETTQVLQYACRAIQLVMQIFGRDYGSQFISMLEKAPSNLPNIVNGASVYRCYVLPAQTNLQRVGMHFAISSIFQQDIDNFKILNYIVSSEDLVRMESGEQSISIGMLDVKSVLTHTQKRFAFAVLYLGKHNIIGNISLNMDFETFHSMESLIIKSFEEGKIGDVLGTMQTFFGSEKYTLAQLFYDEKRKILNQITEQSIGELEISLRRTYNRDYPFMAALHTENIPMPHAYKSTLSVLLNIDLRKTLTDNQIHTKSMDKIISDMQRWNIDIEDPYTIERLSGDFIYREIDNIKQDTESKRLTKLNKLFPLLKQMKIRPYMHKAQNLYFQTSLDFRETGKLNQVESAWKEQFLLLGENVGVKIEA